MLFVKAVLLKEAIGGAGPGTPCRAMAKRIPQGRHILVGNGRLRPTELRAEFHMLQPAEMDIDAAFVDLMDAELFPGGKPLAAEPEELLGAELDEVLEQVSVY